MEGGCRCFERIGSSGRRSFIPSGHVSGSMRVTDRMLRSFFDRLYKYNSDIDAGDLQIG